jgi:hypothetical protein
LIWYFLWRNEKKERVALYDCDICSLDSNCWYKRRICFHPEFGQGAYPFKLPVFDPLLKKLDNTQTEERIFSQDEFLQWLYDTNERYIPNMPAFEFVQGLLKSKNPEICLTAFVDSSLGEIVDMESSCSIYHCLPYKGALLDQPQYYLDVFSVIQTERNRYERTRSDKLLAQSKKGTQGDTNKKGKGLKGFFNRGKN